MKNIFIFAVFLYISCGYKPTNDIKSKRVCVIGAGIAGLTSARYLNEEGMDFTVLEATRYVGGTWRYEPRTGTDENGLPLHTSMYKHLRTNLPKPTMELRGFPLPKSLPSFPSWEDYYQYLQDYAEHFDILKYIQFLHNVISVTREGNRWKVKHQHALTKEIFEEYYDYVIVGTIIHSHDYRTPTPYVNRRVLVIGAGPSGLDIGLDVAAVSKSLIHSHHTNNDFKKAYPSNYVRKPDVKELNETGVLFVDGTFEELDDIIYCTGFQFDYPFLDESSGLTIKPKSVTPLYKKMVNIKQPSIVFMGLVLSACLVVALDAQARYATALIKGNFTLPSEADMMYEWETRMNEISTKNLRSSVIHLLGDKEDEYYADLSSESGIDRVPPVMSKIRSFVNVVRQENFNTFRNYEYTVIDDYTFSSKLEDNAENNNTIL